jgi:hypothetical protein
MTSATNVRLLFRRMSIAALALTAFVAPAMAQVTPPDLTVCDGVDCQTLPTMVCSDGGYKITLTNYTPASGTTSGMASYTYEVCSPPAGTCQGGPRDGNSCSDNSFCQTKGQETDPTATCSRECAVDTFRGISHFDVQFPELGTSACLSDTTSVTGSCAISVNASGSASVGGFVLGDGSCFDGGTSQGSVAKCDGTSLQPGDCLTMTLNIAGETNGLGLGAAIVVDKDANVCNGNCLAGPSCDGCDTPPPGAACLTRTIGFWGTHPWITNDYDPISVCGYEVGCNGASDGKSDPSCQVGSKDSIMEALGSIGGEAPRDASYIAMLKQLAAAKLSLNATAALFDGASCADWRYQDKTIQEWIGYCESLCGASKATISGSGCIEALDAFNQDQDTGFSVTPAPFARPSVDDFENVSGADGSAFTAAQGNSNPPGKCVIGKTANCK